MTLLKQSKWISWCIDLIIIITLAALTYQVELFERESNILKNREAANKELALAQSNISLKLVTGLSLVEETRILFGQNINWSPEDFNEYAIALTAEHNEIKNIGIAFDYIIRYVSPIEGNEGALGLNYRNIPAQYEAARKVIENGKTIITNLIHLVQGGDGIIARIPFFIDGRGDEKNWGLISIVWDVDEFFLPIHEQLENLILFLYYVLNLHFVLSILE